MEPRQRKLWLLGTMEAKGLSLEKSPFSLLSRGERSLYWPIISHLPEPDLDRVLWNSVKTRLPFCVDKCQESTSNWNCIQIKWKTKSLKNYAYIWWHSSFLWLMWSRRVFSFCMHTGKILLKNSKKLHLLYLTYLQAEIVLDQFWNSSVVGLVG